MKEQCFKLHPKLHPKPKQQKEKQQPKESKAEAYMATSRQTDRLAWFLDSAATNHICQSKENFVTYSAESLSSITVGGSNAVKVSGRGSIRIEFLLSDGSINEVLLTNVLYVPDFGTNLVSATALMSKGLSIMLAEPTCKIRRHDGSTLAEGERIGGLIRLSTTVPLPRAKEAIAHLTQAETDTAKATEQL
jgi:hypothetical protein